MRRFFIGMCALALALTCYYSANGSNRMKRYKIDQKRGNKLGIDLEDRLRKGNLSEEKRDEIERRMDNVRRQVNRLDKVLRPGVKNDLKSQGVPGSGFDSKMPGGLDKRKLSKKKTQVNVDWDSSDGSKSSFVGSHKNSSLLYDSSKLGKDEAVDDEVELAGTYLSTRGFGSYTNEGEDKNSELKSEDKSKDGGKRNRKRGKNQIKDEEKSKKSSNKSKKLVKGKGMPDDVNEPGSYTPKKIIWMKRKGGLDEGTGGESSDMGESDHTKSDSEIDLSMSGSNDDYGKSLLTKTSSRALEQNDEQVAGVVEENVDVNKEHHRKEWIKQLVETKSIKGREEWVEEALKGQRDTGSKEWYEEKDGSNGTKVDNPGDKEACQAIYDGLVDAYGSEDLDEETKKDLIEFLKGRKSCDSAWCDERIGKYKKKSEESGLFVDEGGYVATDKFIKTGEVLAVAVLPYVNDFDTFLRVKDDVICSQYESENKMLGRAEWVKLQLEKLKKLRDKHKNKKSIRKDFWVGWPCEVECSCEKEELEALYEDLRRIESLENKDDESVKDEGGVEVKKYKINIMKYLAEGAASNTTFLDEIINEYEYRLKNKGEEICYCSENKYWYAGQLLAWVYSRWLPKSIQLRLLDGIGGGQMG